MLKNYRLANLPVMALVILFVPHAKADAVLVPSEPLRVRAPERTATWATPAARQSSEADRRYFHEQAPCGAYGGGSFGSTFYGSFGSNYAGGCAPSYSSPAFHRVRANEEYTYRGVADRDASNATGPRTVRSFQDGVPLRWLRSR